MRRIDIRLALLLLCLALGCTARDRPAGNEEIAWRLIDWPSVEASPSPPFHPHPESVELGATAPTTTEEPSRAMINSDPRYTFRRPELTFVYRNPHFEVPDTEHVSLDIGVPDKLQDCDALPTEITLTQKKMSVSQHAMGWCTAIDGTKHLGIEVQTPRALRATSVDLWVHARPAPPQGIRQRRFTIPTVPEGARLALAYGVENAGWAEDAAAATFHVLIEDDPKPLFMARLDPALNESQRRWFQTSIDLSRYAGKRLPLILQTALDRADDRRPFSQPVWGDPIVLAPRRGNPR